MGKPLTVGWRQLDADAVRLASELLGGMGDRWLHTKSVAARAAAAEAAVPAEDRELLVAAAWLHDLGYAPVVRESGFHPLDGAGYLETLHAPRRLVALVAHHSCARFEAAQRGLSEELSVYDRESGPVADALIFADMTTGPAGQLLTVEARVEEILSRYPADSPVHRAIASARPELVAAVARTEQRLTDAGVRQPM